MYSIHMRLCHIVMFCVPHPGTVSDHMTSRRCSSLINHALTYLSQCATAEHSMGRTPSVPQQSTVSSKRTGQWGSNMVRHRVKWQVWVQLIKEDVHLDASQFWHLRGGMNFPYVSERLSQSVPSNDFKSTWISTSRIIILLLKNVTCQQNFGEW